MSSETTGSSWFYDFLGWLELNKKRLIYVGAVLVVLVLLGYTVAWQRSQTELRASTALMDLRDIAGEETPVKQDAGAFFKVAREHAGTSAGARALLLGAQALYNEGKYADAQARFDEFLKNYGGNPLAPIAAYGTAVCLDALSKTNEAQAAYQVVINRYSTDATASQARLALARIHEAAGQFALALKIYSELGGASSTSAFKSEAEERKERLLFAHPDLAPAIAVASATNAPAPGTSVLPAATGKP